MIPLRYSNPSAGSLHYIPNFDNKGTNLMICNTEENRENLYKFLLDYTVNHHIPDDELGARRESDPIFS
jgi:hypothetical protein